MQFTDFVFIATSLFVLQATTQKDNSSSISYNERDEKSQEDANFRARNGRNSRFSVLGRSHLSTPVRRQEEILDTEFSSTLLPSDVKQAPSSDITEEFHYQDSDVDEIDQYTFAALLDIIFSDGCKRSCTGAIVHSHVVVTAAHCFTFALNQFLQPELSLSFVVMGTKLMFETGYEQYLPMERVVTHPRYKGWTADLALVFTFADMKTNKPGAVVPMPTARSMTPMDTNVTVFSWGRCKSDVTGDVTIETRASNKDNEQFKMDLINIQSRNKKHQMRAIQNQKQNEARNVNTKGDKKSQYNVPPKQPPRGKSKIRTANHSIIPTGIEGDNKNIQENLRQNHDMLEENESNLTEQSENAESGLERSHFFSRRSIKKIKSNPIQHFFDLQDYDSRRLLQLKKNISMSDSKQTRRSYRYKGKHPNRYVDIYGDGKYIRVHRRRNTRRHFPQSMRNFQVKQHSENWRRHIGQQHNNLTVGTFGYVNLASCKKIVERSLPPLYEIKNTSEVLCFSSDEFYITNEDSGAPVVQSDELVAITVGGVDSDGEHVAVGMKIACFCPWIVANLPESKGFVPKLKCCQNCCNEKQQLIKRDMSSKEYKYLTEGNNFPSFVHSKHLQPEDYEPGYRQPARVGVVKLSKKGPDLTRKDIPEEENDARETLA